MKLAREFRRIDWRNMLADLSSTEYSEWGEFYHHHFFEDALLDAHFAALNLNIVSLAIGENTLNPGHFSLIDPIEVAEAVETDDDQLMALAESLHGGMRYGPASG